MTTTMQMTTTMRVNDPAAASGACYLLVMTATIIPAANAGVRRADPKVRLEDYKQALRHWLRDSHPATSRILLLENSGADLTELQAIADDENPHAKSVEILSVPGNQIPEGSNYGYTEMKMLDEGLALSSLRRQTTHMIKVTGRLIFPALGTVLNKIDPPELMIDCRKLGFPRRGFDANTQLFVCTHDFYDRVLRNAKQEMNSTDVRLLEHLIFRKVIPFKEQLGIHLRFPRNIEPHGYSGFKSKSYRSPSASITRSLRALLRIVAPNYWF
jgi:hypothetical protein